jgi:hypothetical protein
MKRLSLVFMALSVAALLGCNSFKGYVESYVEIGKERGMSEEYMGNLQRWTRNQTAYSQFETQFYISATYKSDNFNQSFIKEQARFLNLTQEEKARRETLQRQAVSDYTEFFFYAYTAVRTANDFADRNSTWRVFLVDEGGRQLDPLEIRKVERDKVTPIIESFFPYVHKYYGYCYHIKFPKQSSFPLKLVFASHLGQIELIWHESSP